MSVDLGWAPLPATIHLSAAGDFTFTFTTEDTSDWPAGTAVTVVFDDTDATSWSATRSGPDLSWNVDKVAVAALLQRGTFTASIRYSDGAGVDVEWMRARVVTGTGAVPQSQIVATLPSAPTVVVLPVATAGGGGGGSGTVVSIGQGAHITVDATDPASPVVGVTPGAFDAAGAADAAQTAAIAGAATYTDGEITAEVSRANAAYDAAGAAAAEATARAAADALLIPLTQKATANGVATLDSNGTVPSAQIPALALTATVVVASQVAMLALTTSQVQPGDLAVRTDGAGTFILTATDPSVLSNWTRLNAPTDVVVSVNGQTGTVTLGPTDVGADATGSASAAQAAAAADATTKANAAQAFAIQRGNHTGTQSADTIVDGTTNKVLSAADKTRLANTSGTNTGDQDLSALAPKASPALTGVPTVPTAPPGTNSTQAASTAYADAAAAAASVGLLDYRGTYNASGNTFPASGGSGSAGAVVKGDFWIVATPGTLGGTAVANGDLVIALTDTPGQTSANWDLIEHDVGYAPENVANKSTDGTLAANSDTLYPSQKAAKTYADAVQAAAATDATTKANAKVEDSVTAGHHSTAPSGDAVSTALALKAPLASPALTGSPTAPTQTQADNSTKLATTAYVDTLGATKASAAGVYSVVAYGAKADVNFISDGAMSSTVNTTTLTSSSGKFAAGDVGKVIVVNNAKGVATHLYATITGFTDSNHVTLSVACTATVSATFVTWGTNDTTAIQAAITAAGAAGGGKVLLAPTSSMITATLTDSTGVVAIDGLGVSEHYGSMNGPGLNAAAVPCVAPYLTGSVLVVGAANTNAILFTAAGTNQRCSNFGILFAGLWGSTGHGIIHTPPTFAGGPDTGLIGAHWERLSVFGHDGSHYAYSVTNSLYCTFTHVHSFGGGGIQHLQNNTQNLHTGNFVAVHPYIMLMASGTAHGVQLQGNLMAWVRPQVLAWPMGTQFPGYGLTVSNSQFLWSDAAAYDTLIAADLEGTTGGGYGFAAGGGVLPGAYFTNVNNSTTTAGIPPAMQFFNEQTSVSTIDGAIMNPVTGTMSTRPSPVVMGAGGQSFQSETNKPIWSNGNDWFYADGTLAFVAGTPGGAGTAPGSVAGGPIGWWAADALGLSSGAAVSSWTDSSAGGPNPLLQATGAKQPTFLTGLLNSKPIVRFNGSTHLMSAAFTLPQPTTIVIVMKVVGWKALNKNNTPTFLDGGINNTIEAQFSPVAGTVVPAGTIAVFGGTLLTASNAPLYVAADQWAIFTLVLNGASSSIRYNGTQNVAGNAGSATPGGVTLGARQGGGSPARIDVAEAVCFNTALSGANCLAVERWLATKYALASA